MAENTSVVGSSAFRWEEKDRRLASRKKVKIVDREALLAVIVWVLGLIERNSWNGRIT